MESKKRQAFSFFRSFYEAGNELPDEQRLPFYDAVLQYALDDTTPTISGATKALFIAIKPVLDKSKTRSSTGAIGGATSKTQANDKQNDSAEQPDGSKTEANAEQSAKNRNRTESHICKDKFKDLGLGVGVGSRTGDKDKPPVPPAGGGDGAAQPSRFDRFWAAYPKKTAKKDAQKAWAKIKPAPSEELLAKMLAKLAEQRQSAKWQEESGRFIPNPATWLNGGRWDDECAETGGQITPYQGGRQANAAPMSDIDRIIAAEKAKSQGGG